MVAPGKNSQLAVFGGSKLSSRRGILWAALTSSTLSSPQQDSYPSGPWGASWVQRRRMLSTFVWCGRGSRWMTVLLLVGALEETKWYKIGVLVSVCGIYATNKADRDGISVSPNEYLHKHTFTAAKYRSSITSAIMECFCLIATGRQG